MSTRCKEGDLAIVIHDTPQCASNIGRLVQVRGPLAYNRTLELSCWLIKPVRNELWMVERHAEVGAEPFPWMAGPYDQVGPERVFWKSKVEHPDAWLLPIRPEDLDQINERTSLELDRFLSSLKVNAGLVAEREA